MTDAVLQALFATIEQRQTELAQQSEQIRARIGELSAQLGELDAESEALRITAKTVRGMANALQQAAATPVMPDGVAYQQIMAVFEQERRPLRARDLCLALDLPLLPKHTEGTRAKLKRLVSLGFLDETEPGLFTQQRLQEADSATDQLS